MPDEQQGQGDGGTGSQGSGTPGGSSGAPTRPSSDLDWRARALRAEARVQQLEALAAELAQKLESAQSQLAAAERKRQIERSLADTGAIDLETASLLVENSLNGSPAPDVPAAVADLRRRKPFLFSSSPRPSAMSGIGAPAADTTLAAAADEARATGDRNALLRYLRMKRSQ